MLWPRPKPGFRRKTVRNEAVLVGDRDIVTELFKSTFENCELTIVCPARGLTVIQCIFRSCIIRAKKPQVDHQFFTSTFEGCRFIGKFPGCEFGFRIDLHGKQRGTIANCDFTAAELDLVSFNNCDLNTMKLPLWPHFTIAEPATTAGRIPNPRSCEGLQALIGTARAMTEITKGITCYAPDVAADCVYSEEELHALLTGVPGIIL